MMLTPLRTPPIPPGATWVLQVVVLASAVVRAADYLSGTQVTPALAVVTAAGPLWVWALLILTGVLVTVAGLAVRCCRMVEGGHMLLAVTYLALGLGQAAATVQDYGLDNMRFWWPWVVASPAVHLVLAHAYGRRVHGRAAATAA